MSILGERLLGVEIAKHMAKQQKAIRSDDDLSGIGTAALAVLEQRQRAEKAEAEVKRLKAALERLGSSNAFAISRVLDADKDAELIMRMDFARKALEAKP